MMINFLQTHTSLITLFFILVTLANFIGFRVYKNKYGNQRPNKRTNLLVTVWLGNLIALGGFWLGILATRTH